MKPCTYMVASGSYWSALRWRIPFGGSWWCFDFLRDAWSSLCRLDGWYFDLNFPFTCKVISDFFFLKFLHSEIYWCLSSRFECSALFLSSSVLVLISAWWIRLGNHQGYVSFSNVWRNSFILTLLNSQLIFELVCICIALLIFLNVGCLNYIRRLIPVQ